MTNTLKTDSFLAGMLIALLSTAVSVGLIVLVMKIAQVDILPNARWMALALVPAILLLRNEASRKRRLASVKGMIVALFVLVVALIVVLSRLLLINQ